MAPEFEERPEFHMEDKDIRGSLDRWCDSVHSQAERPDWFWARQRARILSDIRQPRRLSPKFAWAGLAAVVAIAISLISPVEKPKQSPPQPVAQSQISDHDLMIAIEHSMNNGGPSSLSPASLLAEEMDEALQSQGMKVQKLEDQSQKAKENSYAN